MSHAPVETPDAVLVAHKDRVQEVKDIVQRLNDDGRPEEETHRKVHRPWGTYEIVDSGNRFQTKRLTVQPGAALSLQMHHHRAEHWVVVSGTATVTRGDEVAYRGAGPSWCRLWPVRRCVVWPIACWPTTFFIRILSER